MNYVLSEYKFYLVFTPNQIVINKNYQRFFNFHLKYTYYFLITKVSSPFPTELYNKNLTRSDKRGAVDSYLPT